MSTQKNEKSLDELISRSINTAPPEFDAEAWKKKYPDALQSIVSRRAKPGASRQPNVFRRIFANPIAGLAAAAAVAIVVTGLFFARDRNIPNRPTSEPRLIAQSPARIVSMMSLRMAYQRGGWEALDRQLRDTLEMLGPGSPSLSMQQLLEGSNGS